MTSIKTHQAADSGSREAASLFAQNVRFVPNVPKRAKCPKCPGTGEMS
nr:MAG TPA: hypothetical protein [Caudoviricetes sp.]